MLPRYPRYAFTSLYLQRLMQRDTAQCSLTPSPALRHSEANARPCSLQTVRQSCLQSLYTEGCSQKLCAGYDHCYLLHRQLAMCSELNAEHYNKCIHYVLHDNFKPCNVN